MKYNESGLENLIVGILIQACDDYRRLYRKLYKCKELTPLEYRDYKQLKRFFTEDFGLYTDLDGNSIMKTIEKRIENGEEFTISQEHHKGNRKR